MALDADFVQTARHYFNPYTPSSGTEHVAVLLYALARMTRPQVVVEYGSGYSTLWLLKALAENRRDADEEHELLVRKTARTGILQKLSEQEAAKPFAEWDAQLKAATFEWFATNDKSCGVDPRFHLTPHRPHVYSFEALPEPHPYPRRLSAAVEAMGLKELFTLICGRQFSVDALPSEHRRIDWAWNDHTHYREFFTEFWEHLNPAGGIMVFHNVPGSPEAGEDLAWMKQQRAGQGDLEVLVLEESHKLDQKGCAILRRTSGYRPRHLAGNAAGVLNDLGLLVGGSPADHGKPPLA